jgi:hypothetical protein
VPMQLLCQFPNRRDCHALHVTLVQNPIILSH